MAASFLEQGMRLALVSGHDDGKHLRVVYLFGVKPRDHPQPRRPVLHRHWPAGWYPMRQDAAAPRAELGDDGRLARVKVFGPSFLDWPALPVSLADTMVPDFPLANKSFNLSYAGNDLSCQETQCDLLHAPIRPARTRSRRTDDGTQELLEQM